VSLTFASIADDDTGAADLAGMLCAQDMRTFVVLDEVSPEELRQWAQFADALVIAAGTRALGREQAYRKTREAIESVRRFNPKVVGIKYCSTFDSTPEGNIGASIDAALDALSLSFTVAVAALPVNGRTTYMGHHFVDAQLLSDSSMRQHPLNPMTNSNLVSHLQSQTTRRVGLAKHPEVRAGACSLTRELKKLQSSGVEIAIVDCICDEDLAIIAEAVAEMPLITGSSGLAITLPAQWRRLGYYSKRKYDSSELRCLRTTCGSLIVSGSCSQATRTQCRVLKERGIVSFDIHGVDLLMGTFEPNSVAKEAAGALKAGRDVLIATITDGAAVQEAQQWAAINGLDVTTAGQKISTGLGLLTREILSQAIPQGLILAGGETSTILCRMLGVKALAVSHNIVPGVPLCVSVTDPRIPMVLKSGNFGGVDFFPQAIDAIRILSSRAAE
jgi:3-dehydrotetronate 4-kinase